MFPVKDIGVMTISEKTVQDLRVSSNNLHILR